MSPCDPASLSADLVTEMMFHENQQVCRCSEENKKMLFPVLFKKKKKVLFNTFRHFNVLLFSLIIAVLFLSHRDLKLACIFILRYCLTDHLPHPIGCP